MPGDNADGRFFRIQATVSPLTPPGTSPMENPSCGSRKLLIRWQAGGERNRAGMRERWIGSGATPCPLRLHLRCFDLPRPGEGGRPSPTLQGPVRLTPLRLGETKKGRSRIEALRPTTTDSPSECSGSSKPASRPPHSWKRRETTPYQETRSMCWRGPSPRVGSYCQRPPPPCPDPAPWPPPPPSPRPAPPCV